KASVVALVLASTDPFAPPAVSVARFALTLLVPPLLVMLPALAVRVALPVVVTGPATFRSPVVLVTPISPLPFVDVLMLAPSSSIPFPHPTPCRFKASVVALVLASTDPIAPPAVSVARFALTLLVPPLLVILPALAVRVALPVVVTGPATFRSPVVLVTPISPLPVVAVLMLAPSSSVTVIPPVL